MVDRSVRSVRTYPTPPVNSADTAERNGYPLAGLGHTHSSQSLRPISRPMGPHNTSDRAGHRANWRHSRRRPTLRSRCRNV